MFFFFCFSCFLLGKFAEHILEVAVVTCLSIYITSQPWACSAARAQVGGQRVALGIPQADATAEAMRAMVALGRVGEAEEAAGAMLLLASPYASYITGQAVEVTGGGWMGR